MENIHPQRLCLRFFFRCVLSEDLLIELRENLEKGALSRFVSNALQRELQRLRQQKFLDASFGEEKLGKHAKLAGGVDPFV